MIRYAVLNTHRRLHARLVEDAVVDTEFAPASPRGADIVVWPVSQWPDPGAPERFAGLDPRLWRKLYLWSETDRPLVWAPGVFASAPSDRAERRLVRGGFFVPETHDEPPHATGLAVRVDAAPDLLWSFAGSVGTCPALRSHVIALRDDRALLRNTDHWDLDLRWRKDDAASEQRRQAMHDYVDTLHRSSFVVCPRGKGPATIRVFETMRVGRCPVILSDAWIPPPDIDWDSCSLRVAEDDVAALPRILRDREQDAARLGSQARRVWEEHFSRERMLNSVLRACQDLRDGDISRRERAMAPFRAMVLEPRQFVRRARDLIRVPVEESFRVRRP